MNAKGKNLEKPKIIRIDDDDGWRWYEHPELGPTKRAISVTTFIDSYLNIDDQDFLLGIDKEQYRFMMSAVSKVGKAIEELCKRYFDNGKTLVWVDDAEKKKYSKVMANWEWIVKKYNLRPLAWSVRVFNPRYGFAGTIDLIAVIDDEEYGIKDLTCVLDLKTGKYKLKAGYQVSGYRQTIIDPQCYFDPPLRLELPKGTIDDVGCGVIHMHRDGSKKRIYTYENHDWLFTSFLAVMRTMKADFKQKLEGQGYHWLYHDPFREYLGLPQPTKGVADAGTVQPLEADV